MKTSVSHFRLSAFYSFELKKKEQNKIEYSMNDDFN